LFVMLLILWKGFVFFFENIISGTRIEGSVVIGGFEFLNQGIL